MQQALEAYNKGLELAPDDKPLLSGRAAVEQLLVSQVTQQTN